jgi:hypothetical protein
MYTTFSSSVVGHLSCFESLTIVNTAVISTHVQVAVLHSGLRSFGYTPRSGTAG